MKKVLMSEAWVHLDSNSRVQQSVVQSHSAIQATVFHYCLSSIRFLLFCTARKVYNIAPQYQCDQKNIAK